MKWIMKFIRLFWQPKPIEVLEVKNVRPGASTGGRNGRRERSQGVTSTQSELHTPDSGARKIRIRSERTEGDIITPTETSTWNILDGTGQRKKPPN